MSSSNALRSDRHETIIEMRLQGGYRSFWSTITPTVYGRSRTMMAPEFFRDADFFGITADPTVGIWDLWPIDNPARPHPLKQTDQLCRPVRMTSRTPGVALISFLQQQDGALWVELFLSTTETVESGLSAFDDWVQILRAGKDDFAKDIVLRLNLGAVTPDEIAGFGSQKKLVTTDLALEIRPRVF
jgi:hypothetical protein